MRIVLAAVLAALAAPAAAADSPKRFTPLFDEAPRDCGKAFGSLLCAENGELDGAAYHYSANGGFVALAARPGGNRLKGWRIDCKTDSMSDVRTCTAEYGQIRLIDFGDGHGGMWLLSKGRFFPGTPVTVRVGSNAPRTWDSDQYLGGPAFAELVEEMMGGGILKSRRFEWPYDDRPIEEETSLATFPQAWKILKRATELHRAGRFEQHKK